MPMKQLKADALVFTADKLQFAESLDEGRRTPVSMVARTNTIVETFYGSILHDLKGMFHNAKVPVDWRHSDEEPEILGYLDKFEIVDNQLVCSGEIISLESGDLADNIVRKGQAGIPYEASISFGGQGIVIEEIDANVSTTVNDKKFEGPLTIFRKWPLRGMAICLHGADNKTSTSLALGEEEVSVAILTKNKENNMSQEEKTAQEELDKKALKEADEKKAEADKLKKEEEKAKLAEEEAKVAESTDNTMLSSDGKSGPDFIKAYGNDGAVWFAEGKTFSEANTLYTQKLEERIKGLETKLASVDRGGDEELSFQHDSSDDKIKERTTELSTKLGSKLARFAAGLNLRRKQ